MSDTSFSNRLINIVIKSLSALFIGTIIALVGHVFIGYETFGFVFVTMSIAGLCLKFYSKSKILTVLVFNAIFILLLLVLRLYILVAPKI